MLDLIIVGTGAVAAEITSYIECDKYRCEGENIRLKGYLEFEEYRHLHGHYKFIAPILGNISSYKIQESDRFIIANANVNLRKQFVGILSLKGAKFINLIHPSCIIASTSDIGIGNIMSPYCMVGPMSKVGNFNILTSFSCVSHDCIVGNYNSFSTAMICGHVTIGDENAFYIRSTVVPHVVIGDKCTIQANMCVDKDIQDATTVFYKYKERILALPK